MVHARLAYDSESAYHACTTCRHAAATRLDTKKSTKTKGVVLVNRLSEISKRMRVSHKRVLQPKYRKRGYVEGYQRFLESERRILL